MTGDVIRITTGAAGGHARALYDEVRRLLDEAGNRAPIHRIEVARLAGEVYVHCVPVKPARGPGGEG